MRKAIIVVSVAAIASILVLASPILVLEANGGSLEILPLELIPKSNASSILLAKVINPSPLRLSASATLSIYLNGTLALTLSKDFDLGPRESKLIEIYIPMPVERGGRAHVVVKGVERLYPKLPFLPTLLPLSKSVNVERLVDISPCFIKVIAAGFTPPIGVVGEKVIAWVKLFSSDRCSANIVVKIVEDVSLGAGITVMSKSFLVHFPGLYVLNISWSPAYPSGSSLRGYYLEVYVNGTSFYVMPPMYPPRLRVYVTRPTTSTVSTSSPPLEVVSAWWKSNGRRIWVARVGEEVSGCVEIASREPWSGYVTIKIVEDSPLGNVVSENTVFISVSPSSPAIVCVSFIPRAPSSSMMRGYYIVVDVNKATLYVMPPYYPPRLKVVR